MERILYENEHESFRHSVSTFLAKEVAPHFESWDAAGIVPREMFQQYGSRGLFSAVPEEYGGAGNTDFGFNAVFIEEERRSRVSPRPRSAPASRLTCACPTWLFVPGVGRV